MMDSTSQEKQESMTRHVEADEKIGSEGEEHLAGLDDTNVRTNPRVDV